MQAMLLYNYVKSGWCLATTDVGDLYNVRVVDFFSLAPLCVRIVCCICKRSHFLICFVTINFTTNVTIHIH